MREAQCRRFDVVTCMELLEHVPDPAEHGRGLRAGSRKPRRARVLLHHQPQSEGLPVRGDRRRIPARSMLPKGTHDYARFIKPSELVALVPRRAVSSRSNSRA